MTRYKETVCSHCRHMYVRHAGADKKCLYHPTEFAELRCSTCAQVVLSFTLSWKTATASECIPCMRKGRR